MKIYSSLFIILLFFGCENPTSSEIPNDPGNLENNYTTNLYAINSGKNIESVTINWATYTQSGFIEYAISNQNNQYLININDINESIYTINALPAEFQKIYLHIESDENSILDSVTIFTRDIKPITNFTAIANVDDWSTLLEWTPSLEIDSIFSHYTIYRLNTLNYEQFNNLENCNCDIAILNEKSISNYIDDGNFNLGEEYFYIIQTNTTQGYHRKSIIKSNLASINYTCSPIINQDPSPSASQSEYNKITLNWDHNLNELEFYELQIWRSNNSNTDPLNGTLLTTITNYNKLDFEDSYNIGNGTAWFYKIKLIDVHGQEYITDTIMGNSHP